jgi:[protein-PII] uridylyltransferase
MHAERMELSSPRASVGAYKDYIQQEHELLERDHRQGQAGLRVARSRSMMMDVLLENLTRRAAALGKLGAEFPDMALIALGGYGREEMCPYSDVDIMFLYPVDADKDRLARLQQVVTDHILYPLWDMGLKVGHSSRNLTQALAEARGNVQTRLALIEARLITGSMVLWKEFKRTYDSFARKENVPGFLRERMENEVRRHAKFGGTIFLQEPDIKNGVGGLRDYQNAIWTARLKLRIDTVNDLADMGCLTTEETHAFSSAYDFLLRVRNELHFLSDRATDLLDLEKQTQVAWYLGYRYFDATRRVETFMRDYYRNTECIRNTSEYLQYRLVEKDKERPSLRDLVRVRKAGRPSDGFVVKAGKLKPISPLVFEEDPERLIRVFRQAQQTGAQIDLELQRTIRNSRHLIDRNVTHSPTACRAFLAIMEQPGNVFPTLKLMNRCGILHRFIPEWKNLHCLVQHEFYHRFTADYHTLNCIKFLDEIFTRKDDPVCASYQRALRDTSAPTLVYMALLLHDIGKGLGIKGHAHRGATIAKEVLTRLGYNAELGAKIIDIVEHHLDMARFWQRYDVEDPQTALSFAKVISDEETLRFLFVLTYCDARGTSEELWNGYKNMLHGQLFNATLSVLAGKRSIYSPDNMISKEQIRAILPEIPAEEIDAHYNVLPDRYFASSSADEVALHIRMVHELLHSICEADDNLSTLTPVVRWHNDLSLSLTVVNVVTWDRAGLFYKLAGAFSVAGLSIVSSKAISRADHITVDTFYVCDATGGIVQNPRAQATVERCMKKALLRNEDLLPAIIEQEKKHAMNAWARTAGERIHAPVTPNVGIYHEMSLKHTIVEVQCPDRIGLLYSISKSIFDNGFDITFARIATERGVAMDTFYIEKIDSRAGDAADILQLRENLSAIANGHATTGEPGASQPAAGNIASS